MDAVTSEISLVDRRRWCALPIFAHMRFLEVTLFHIALLLDKLRSGVYNFMEVKKNFQYPLENLLNLWYNYDIVPG